jgi:hypothetical protein
MDLQTPYIGRLENLALMGKSPLEYRIVGGHLLSERSLEFSVEWDGSRRAMNCRGFF